MLPLLLDLLLKSTLLLALALLLPRLVRRTSAAERHLALTLAFVSMLTLPFFACLLPAWKILPSFQTPPAASRPAEMPIEPVPTLPAIVDPSPMTTDTLAAAPAIGSLPAPHVGARKNIPIDPVTTLYLTGVLLAILPLLLAHLVLRRLRKHAAPLADSPWPELLDNCRLNLSLKRPAILLKSNRDAVMPMTWGLRRPLILLPHDVESWTPARRRIVLLHELAHIRRQDIATHLLARLACALYWFNPIIWLALRQLRIEAELACDDLLLTAAIRPSAYATELLDIAAAFRPPHLSSAALSMARAGNRHLHTRIRALLDATRTRRPLSRHTAALLALGATLVVPLSMLQVHAQGSAAPAATSAPATAPSDFPRLVHFTIGAQSFAGGNFLTITDIHGTADTIAPGNTYQIKGTYTLESEDEADLSVYVTATSPDDTHHDPYNPRQTVHVKKGDGAFTLVLPFISPGHPHLSFYPAAGGTSFTSLYFGTDDALGSTPIETDKPASAPVTLRAEVWARTVHITSRTDGIVTKTALSEGQQVKRHEFLLQLDTSDKQYAYDVATTTLNAAQAKADRLSKRVDATTIEIEDARTAAKLAQLAKQKAETELTQNVFISPVDGIIEHAFLGEGSAVKKGDDIATIIDTSEFKVHASVPQTYLSRIHPGQSYTLTTAAYPSEKWTGEITGISPTIDSAAGTCTITGSCKGDTSHLKLGMQAIITLNPN